MTSGGLTNEEDLLLLSRRNESALDADSLYERVVETGSLAFSSTETEEPDDPTQALQVYNSINSAQG